MNHQCHCEERSNLTLIFENGQSTTYTIKMKNILYILLLTTQVFFAQSGFEKGNELYKNGKYDQAVEAYENVLKENKQSAELYFNLGNSYYKLNKVAPSIYYYEKALRYNYSKNNFRTLIEATYFNRHTNNWIIWLPGDNGYWTPRNLLQVHSRGTETKTTLTYLKNKLFLKLDLSTSYILSTNTKNINVNDNSKDRQLIYSPRYAGYATFLIQYKKLTIYYNYNYTGYRFTSTDNTSWLMPYHISNLKIATNFNFEKTKDRIFYKNMNL